jgi:transcriptional regulator with XRE-family HTH domain
MGTNNEIGMRIAELRDICGYTREEMAEALGVDPSTYDAYELSGEDIPIGAIFRIANKCGVDFTEIVSGAGGNLNTFQVVRSGEGLEVSRKPGYSYKDLAFRYGQKIMQPTMVTLGPGEPELNTHEGQEFDFVVSGSMKLYMDGREIILNAGDSVYLNPTHPHGFSLANGEPCLFLAVISE